MSPRDPNTALRRLPRTGARPQIADLLTLLLLLGVSCGDDPQPTASQSTSDPPPTPPATATEYPPVSATAPSPQPETTQTRTTSPAPILQGSPSQCANGVAVPDPEKNAGLVQDCDTLLEIRDTLLISPDLDCEALIDIRNFISGGKPVTCLASSSDWCGGGPEGRY